MPELLDSIAELLLADFTTEAGAGFPTVRRIPSTDAVKFLDYFGALEPAARTALLEAKARGAALQFFPPPLVHQQALDFLTKNPALNQYRTATQSGHFAYGLRYVDPRMARAMLNDPQSRAQLAQTRAALDFQPRDDPPRDLTAEADLRNIVPAKAPLLRKLMETAFARLFAPKKSKLPGGETRYTGTLGATELVVSIDYASRMAQFAWFVGLRMAHPNLAAFRVQDFWGLTGWDYLTEENAARSIELLCERITYLVNLKNRIDALA